MSQRPAFSCLALTPTVKAIIAVLRQAAAAEIATFEVAGSVAEGHVTVKEGGALVYRALQKGKSQPWIVSGYDTDSVTWGNRQPVIG